MLAPVGDPHRFPVPDFDATRSTVAANGQTAMLDLCRLRWGGVTVLLLGGTATVGERAVRLPNDLASVLRGVLDPHGERTAPTGLYWPGVQREPRRAYGLGGPDPTAPE